MQNMSKLFKWDHQIHNSPVNRWKSCASRRKSMNVAAWKVSMTLEFKNHSDTPAGPSSWIFYRPEWVSIGKKLFSSKILILYTVRMLTKN